MSHSLTNFISTSKSTMNIYQFSRSVFSPFWFRSRECVTCLHESSIFRIWLIIVGTITAPSWHEINLFRISMGPKTSFILPISRFTSTIFEKHQSKMDFDGIVSTSFIIPKQLLQHILFRNCCLRMCIAYKNWFALQFKPDLSLVWAIDTSKWFARVH